MSCLSYSEWRNPLPRDPCQYGSSSFLRDTGFRSGPHSGQQKPTSEETIALGGYLSLERPCSVPILAANKLGSGQYKKLGSGNCGTIIAERGRSRVFKVARRDKQALANEYINQKVIEDNFNTFPNPHVRTPKCLGFFPSERRRPGQTQTRLDKLLEERPGLVETIETQKQRVPGVLVMERIRPIHRRAAHLLIKRYCPWYLQPTCSADKSNLHCLVRPLLGSIEGKMDSIEGRTGVMSFSLRDFELHLNQMVDLRMNSQKLAQVMGYALAVIHFGARLDARGVEFVLGRPPDDARPRSEVCLWVIDFDKVRSVDHSPEGVAKCVAACLESPPFYPKPRCKSLTKEQSAAWAFFAESYLETCKEIRYKRRWRPSPWAWKFLTSLVAIVNQTDESLDTID